MEATRFGFCFGAAGIRSDRTELSGNGEGKLGLVAARSCEERLARSIPPELPYVLEVPLSDVSFILHFTVFPGFHYSFCIAIHSEVLALHPIDVTSLHFHPHSSLFSSRTDILPIPLLLSFICLFCSYPACNFVTTFLVQGRFRRALPLSSFFRILKFWSLFGLTWHELRVRS
jgi:hypothetical protein